MYTVGGSIGQDTEHMHTHDGKVLERMIASESDVVAGVGSSVQLESSNSTRNSVCIRGGSIGQDSEHMHTHDKKVLERVIVSASVGWLE